MPNSNACTLFVCATCKKTGGQEIEQDPEGPRPGAQMLLALSEQCPPQIKISPVECLSACARGCSVALAGAGKWTYVFADMDPRLHAKDILRGAALYAASADGLVPWRERPEIFKKQCVARIPPQETA